MTMFMAQPGVIAGSSATEAGLASSMLASAMAKAFALVGVLPMGADPTSALFAATVNGTGAEYLAAHGLHVANRTLWSGGQQLAAGTIEATEAIRALTTAIA